MKIHLRKHQTLKGCRQGVCIICMNVEETQAHVNVQKKMWNVSASEKKLSLAKRLFPLQKYQMSIGEVQRSSNQHSFKS